MSLRDRLKITTAENNADWLYREYGISENPFPASNQTSANPHRPIPADRDVEDKILAFVKDHRSQVVVIEGTQGVGKTNFLNHFESEIKSVMGDLQGFYMVRYLADPEPSFEGTTRRLFEELGTDHLLRLRENLQQDQAPINQARSNDMRTALRRLIEHADERTPELILEWFLGLRVLKEHRTTLGVQFRLDTVESKTSALRDIVQVSAAAGVLQGIFVLLDEVEKHGGVLGPRAIVRYLSALRSVIDALPERLFLMIGITPDAQLRYSAALPALRGRLQNQVALSPLMSSSEAVELSDFYLEASRQSAAEKNASGELARGESELLSEKEVADCFNKLLQSAERLGNQGVRQREFLHALHDMAAKRISP